MIQYSRIAAIMLVGVGVALAFTTNPWAVARADEKPAAEASAKEAPVPDTWHASTFVTGGIGLRIIRYWSKGDWMRAETLIRGHPVVTLVRDEYYVGFDVLTGKGVKVRRSQKAQKEDAARVRPFGNDLDELKAQGGDKVEEELRSGRAVEVWQKSDAAGRRKLWVTKDEPRLPIRLEMFVRSGAETITTEYTDWVRGIEMRDAFFEAPANIVLEEFDYERFLEVSAERPVGPVLYPDLLHGSKLR